MFTNIIAIYNSAYSIKVDENFTVSQKIGVLKDALRSLPPRKLSVSAEVTYDVVASFIKKWIDEYEAEEAEAVDRNWQVLEEETPSKEEATQPAGTGKPPTRSTGKKRKGPSKKGPK